MRHDRRNYIYCGPNVSSMQQISSRAYIHTRTHIHKPHIALYTNSEFRCTCAQMITFHLFHIISVLVDQLVERRPGLPYVFAKGVSDQVRDPLTPREIPFSKELTDNYCALGLLFESITCNNNNNNFDVLDFQNLILIVQQMVVR